MFKVNRSSLRRWFWSFVAAFCIMCAWSAARAQAPTVTYEPTGGSVSMGPLNNSGSADFNRIMGGKVGTLHGSGVGDSELAQLLKRPANLGDVTISDKVSPRVGSKSVPMAVARNVPWSAVGKAVAKSLPIISTAIAAKEIADAIRAKPTPEGDGVMIDPGVPKQDATVWVTDRGAKGATTSAACGAHAKLFGPLASPFQFPGRETTCYVKQNDTIIDAWTSGMSTIVDKQCPPVIDPLDPNASTNAQYTGQDGLCPTGRYSRATPEEFGRKVDQLPVDAPARAQAPAALDEALRTGLVDVTPDAGPASLGGPATAQGVPSTVTTTPAPTPENPNPAPQTSTTTPNYSITYNNTSYSYTTINITNNADGSSTVATPPADVQTCGLPGKPACKIDETGTPEADTKTPTKDAQDAFKDLKDIIDNPASKLPAFPQIAWDFALPSACSPISVPAFAPYLEEVDMCRFQPMFHDVMSVIWVVGGIFGAVGLFFRDQMSAL